MNKDGGEKISSEVNALVLAQDIKFQLEVLLHSKKKEYQGAAEEFKKGETGAYRLSMISALLLVLESSDALIHHLENVQGCCESCQKHDNEIKIHKGKLHGK